MLRAGALMGHGIPFWHIIVIRQCVSADETIQSGSRSSKKLQIDWNLLSGWIRLLWRGPDGQN